MAVAVANDPLLELEFPHRFVPDADPAAVAAVMALWREAQVALRDPDHQIDPERFPHNYFYWSTQLLVVEDKQTQYLVPFRFKMVQAEIAMVIMHDWIAELPVRLIVLKARREGVSTMVQSFILWVCANRKERKGFTMADGDDTSGYLHQMLETFYENLPGWAQPMRGVSRAGKVIEFSNPSKNKDEKRRRPGLRSWIRTVSHTSAGAGKGSTLLHLSEIALWAAQTAAKSLGTILQVVPRAPRTLVVQESTARGIGNIFHNLYNRARMGVSGYRAIFIGWPEEPTNVMPVPIGFTRTAEEDELAREYDLSDDQLMWRRVTIEDECSGDLDTFHQEYPINEDEAFLASGRPYFPAKQVRDQFQVAKSRDPALTGHLVEQDELNGNAGPWTIFVPSPRRFTLRIWNAPHELDDYLIFGDAAGGKPDQDILVAGESRPMKARGDWHAAYVFSRTELRIVAAWHGRVDRDEYGDHLFRLGKTYAGVTHTQGPYKGALIAVEISGGWGQVPLSRLKWRDYHRLYHRPVAEDVTVRDRSSFLGWDSTIKTRPLMLDALKQVVRSGELECPDPFLYQEMATFVYNDVGKPEAMPGTFDDRVMAAAGGVYLWIHEPRRYVVEDEEQPAPRSAVTGY